MSLIVLSCEQLICLEIWNTNIIRLNSAVRCNWKSLSIEPVKGRRLNDFEEGPVVLSGI